MCNNANNKFRILVLGSCVPGLSCAGGVRTSSFQSAGDTVATLSCSGFHQRTRHYHLHRRRAWLRRFGRAETHRKTTPESRWHPLGNYLNRYELAMEIFEDVLTKSPVRLRRSRSRSRPCTATKCSVCSLSRPGSQHSVHHGLVPIIKREVCWQIFNAGSCDSVVGD